MIVQTATADDIPQWLELAAEVENLLGPMVNEVSFQRALEKSIGRQSAFCVREKDGRAGDPLMGGLLFSARPPVYRIGWLVVASRWRGNGVGSKLVEHVLGLVEPPAEVMVITFRADDPEGEPARRLYQRFGFTPAELVVADDDSPRQVFRRVFPRGV